jgi:outer membrane protein
MTLRFFAVLLSLAAPLAAQNPVYQVPDPGPFNLFGGYVPREVPEPVFANTPRIDQFVREGKIMLSLNDAIALALENNLDLGIARYNLVIADTDVLRTKAGAATRGVATGLVQGTPGGGVGGFGAGAPGAGAGGTSGGAGGAGAGASGLVQSTLGAGADVPSFDPLLGGTLNIQHATFPLANTITTGGVSNFQQNSGIANFDYTQGFSTGTVMNVSFDNARGTNNSLGSILVPELNTGFRLTLSQRLLQGFGFGPNTRFIRIARNNREISDIAFRNQVVATVTQIQNIYWDLVNAYEDVRVRERSLALAEKTLSDNKEQVRIGTLAPIEVVRSESEVATRNQELIQAQTVLQLQQLLIKNAITRNQTDPVLAEAPVIPTSKMELPAHDPVAPITDLIEEALAHRPELAQARIDLTNRNISRKAASNALLPSLDLVAWYGASGLAGAQNPSITCAANPCTTEERQQGRTLVPGEVPATGYTNAFHVLFDHNFPDYGVGLRLNVPLRNRAALSDQIRSQLEYRQAQMRLQQLQNQIRIEVRNAQFAVQQNRARVAAATKRRDLAAHQFEIEQKRYQLGASTNNEVLQMQRELAVAESNVVAAMTDYEKALVELDRVTGATLRRNNIQVAEAEAGRIESLPQVPNVVTRPDVEPQ